MGKKEATVLYPILCVMALTTIVIEGSYASAVLAAVVFFFGGIRELGGSDE